MRATRMLPVVALALLEIAACGSAGAVSLSTDALGPGLFGDGYHNNVGDSTVEIIRQIPQNDNNPYPVAYTQNPLDTIDVSPYVVSGAFAGSFGSDEHGRGGNLWITGDGEANVPHVGLGAHANWLITYDLADIKAVHFGASAAGSFRLTGRFGTWGSIGGPGAGDGVVQAAIYLDGVRIDALPQVTHNVPVAGGAATPSQAFDLSFSDANRWLTLAIFNGNDSLGNSTVWDDGIYRNVELAFTAAPVIPEPATSALLGLGSLVLLCRIRRRRS